MSAYQNVFLTEKEYKRLTLSRGLAPHLENRMTVCMGYPAMTPQGRAGKRRRKVAGSPCRENGRTLISQLRRKTMYSK